MAILKIARMGHPALRRRAARVADPTAPAVAALVRDMIETMADAEGLGLAAPQVHVPARVVIFVAPGDGQEDADEDEWSGLTVLVNPAVEPLGEDMEDGWEGCLSVPDLRGLVPRYTRVRFSGTTPSGETVEREAGGMLARVVQHEFDHLDGILYPQRMTDMSKLIFISEFRHQRGPREDAQEGETEGEGPEK